MALIRYGPRRASTLLILALACAAMLIFASSASAAPAYSLTPGAGATVYTSDVAFHMVTTGPVALTKWAQFSVDGNSYGCALSIGFNARTLTADVTVKGLRDGPHKCVLSTMTTSGLVQQTTWTFNVAAPPVITEVTPVNGSSTTTLSPLVSAKVTDIGSGVSSVVLYVDGQLVPSVWTASTGTMSWRPPVHFVDESTHAIRIVARDGLGMESEYSGAFTAHSKPAMLGSCTDCHTKCWAVDNMASIPCLQCHQKHSNPGMSGDCGGCHGRHGPSYITASACIHCHTQTLAHQASHTPSHGTDYSGGLRCSPCHEIQLTREHGARVSDATGTNCTCGTCHGSSASPQVKAAVASGDTGCEHCHTWPDPTGAPGTAVPLDEPHVTEPYHQSSDWGGCQCHATSSNVVAMHGNQCNKCHDNPNKTRIPANANADCRTCHYSFNAH